MKVHRKLWENRKEKATQWKRQKDQDWKSTSEAEIKRKRRIRLLGAGILALTIVLNVIACFVPAFSGWYVTNIFPFWVNVTGRISDLFPFSIGELLLYLAVLLLFAGVILLVMFVIFFYDARIRRVTKRFWSAIAWICNIVLLVQTLNCFILYRSSGFAKEEIAQAQRDEENLIALYNHVAEEANTLASTFPRDDRGFLQVDTKLFNKTAAASLMSIGHNYPQLSGYYPRIKPILMSDSMSQYGMMGIYLPYTMEANYNREMYVANWPFVMCHELAHLKGYIREDEANFLAYVACVQSSDSFFKYSGYLSMINYVAEAIQDTCGWDKKIQAKMTRLNNDVQTDNIFLTQQSWDEINDKKILNTEQLQTISQKITDASLQMNGVGEGIESYEQVVDLMLTHYQRRGRYSE